MASNSNTEVDEYLFATEDPDDDDEKAGFKGRWVGIANSLPRSIFITTHIESSVPEDTSGRFFNLIEGHLS